MNQLFLTASSSALFTLKNLVFRSELEQIIPMARDCLDSSGSFVVHISDDGLESDLSELYEPNGRRQAKANSQLTNLLDSVVSRASKQIEHFLPHFFISEWFVFEYSLGQYIIPHADGAGFGIDADPQKPAQQIALSILLEAPSEGGEFYVVTESCKHDWRNGIRVGLDPTSSSYDRENHPCWKLDGLKAGDGLIFGSELIHGTFPVTSGVALKVIGFANF